MERAVSSLAPPRVVTRCTIVVDRASRAAGLAFSAAWLLGLLLFPIYKDMPAGYVPVAVGVLAALTIGACRSALQRALMTPTPGAFLAGLIGAAIAIRVGAACWFPLAPANDHAMFYDLAKGLIEGRGYVWPSGAPTAFFPPGMPLILAGWLRVLPASPLAPAALGLLVGTALVAATYWFAESVVGGPAARWAAVLVCLNPTLVAYSVTIGYEPLFAIVLLATMALANGVAVNARGRWWRLVAIALLAGCGALIKPVYLLVPVLLAGVWLRLRLRWHAAWWAAAVAAGMLFVIAPWTIRNARELGSPVLISTNGGVVLYSANNPTSRGIATPVTPLAGEVDEVSRDRLRGRAAVQWIASHPGDWARLAVAKLAYGWGTSSSIMSFVSADRMIPSEEDLAKAALNVGWSALFTWCALAAWRTRLWAEPRLFGVLLFTVYLLCIHLIFEALSRHHIPVIPVLAIVAGGWLASPRRRVSPDASATPG